MRYGRAMKPFGGYGISVKGQALFMGLSRLPEVGSTATIRFSHVPERVGVKVTIVKRAGLGRVRVAFEDGSQHCVDIGSLKLPTVEAPGGKV